MKRAALLIAIVLGAAVPALAQTAIQDLGQHDVGATANGVSFTSGGGLYDGINDYITINASQLYLTGFNMDIGGLIIEYEPFTMYGMTGALMLKNNDSNYITMYYLDSTDRHVLDYRYSGISASYQWDRDSGRHVLGAAWGSDQFYGVVDGVTLGSTHATGIMASHTVVSSYIGSLLPPGYLWAGYIGRVVLIINQRPTMAQLSFLTTDPELITPATLADMFGDDGYVFYDAGLYEPPAPGPVTTPTPTPASGDTQFTSHFVELSSGQMAELSYQITAGDFVTGVLLLFVVLLLIAVLIVTLMSARSVD